MRYISRGVNLDEEVWRALQLLREKYGSYNRGLRAILIDRGKPEPRLKLSRKKK